MWWAKTISPAILGGHYSFRNEIFSEVVEVFLLIFSHDKHCWYRFHECLTWYFFFLSGDIFFIIFSPDVHAVYAKASRKKKAHKLKLGRARWHLDTATADWQLIGYGQPKGETYDLVYRACALVWPPPWPSVVQGKSVNTYNTRNDICSVLSHVALFCRLVESAKVRIRTTT